MQLSFACHAIRVHVHAHAAIRLEMQLRVPGCERVIPAMQRATLSAAQLWGSHSISLFRAACVDSQARERGQTSEEKKSSMMRSQWYRVATPAPRPGSVCAMLTPRPCSFLSETRERKGLGHIWSCWTSRRPQHGGSKQASSRSKRWSMIHASGFSGCVFCRQKTSRPL